jgi:hypothetical protein
MNFIYTSEKLFFNVTQNPRSNDFAYDHLLTQQIAKKHCTRKHIFFTKHRHTSDERRQDTHEIYQWQT